MITGRRSFVAALMAAAITIPPISAALAAPSPPQQRPARSGRPTVAIYEMRDLANTGQGATLSQMIETAITSTNKFRVIERNFRELVKEQGAAATGLITSNRPGKIGGFEGADFLIYGAITGLGRSKKGNAGADIFRSMLGDKSANCSNTVASLAIDIKITDSVTGEVRYTGRITQQQTADVACNGSEGGIDATGLMRAAADRIATNLVTTIYPIQIAAFQADGTVVLNYGEGAVTPGALMIVYSKGEQIIDPATGDVIGSNEIKLGFIQVSEVQARLSRATLVTDFPTQPPVGAIVRVASDAEAAALRNQSKRKR